MVHFDIVHDFRIGTGCSSKYDTGIPVTRNVAEKDQLKGIETKQNKREEDSYAATVPVKKEEFSGKLQYPELAEQAMNPVPGERKKQNANRGHHTHPST
ncbi:hypothetical protein [Bacillus cereus]|uniref:hypothetical protein n=1 Tax=Bacillus cereus TaxID=1396 RepID=UPI0015965690|nr:hypothetical protein [Bacillus cereus]